MSMSNCTRAASTWTWLCMALVLTLWTSCSLAAPSQNLSPSNSSKAQNTAQSTAARHSKSTSLKKTASTWETTRMHLATRRVGAPGETIRTAPDPDPPRAALVPAPHSQRNSTSKKAKEGASPKLTRLKKKPVANVASSINTGGSSPNSDSNLDEQDGEQQRPATNPKVIIIAIFVSIGGLAVCFCCLLGASKAAGSFYVGRFGRGNKTLADQKQHPAAFVPVSVAGKPIGPPKPMVPDQSSFTPARPDQQPLQVWNVANVKAMESDRKRGTFANLDVFRRWSSRIKNSTEHSMGAMHITSPVEYTPPRRPEAHPLWIHASVGYPDERNEPALCAKSRRVPAHFPVPLTRQGAVSESDLYNHSDLASLSFPWHKQPHRCLEYMEYSNPDHEASHKTLNAIP